MPFAIPKSLLQCLAEFSLSWVSQIKSLVMTKRYGRSGVFFKDLMSEPKLELPLLSYSWKPELHLRLLPLHVLRLVSQR